MSGANPEIVILRRLLGEETGYVSGSELAEELSVSRVAIWQHMEKLRAHGFDFEAIRARGYRLTGRPTSIYGPLIEAHLQNRQLRFTLECFDEIDSTNDEAMRQLATGRATPFVILAKRQTRGRGRFGRVWQSDATQNLYASFAFRPQVEPARMQTFTLWMGVNVCELVSNFTRLNPGLKWPNDIVFNGHKAGGMLTEARMDADQIRDLIFGLGLNINYAPENLGEPNRQATSLAAQMHSSVDINRFAAAMIGRVLDAYEQFVSGEYRATFAERWNTWDILRGQTVSLLKGTATIRGVAAGLDEEGSLILRTPHGRTERVRAGEVTIEKK